MADEHAAFGSPLAATQVAEVVFRKRDCGTTISNTTTSSLSSASDDCLASDRILQERLAEERASVNDKEKELSDMKAAKTNATSNTQKQRKEWSDLAEEKMKESTHTPDLMLAFMTCTAKHTKHTVWQESMSTLLMVCKILGCHPSE